MPRESQLRFSIGTWLSCVKMSNAGDLIEAVVHAAPPCP